MNETVTQSGRRAAVILTVARAASDAVEAFLNTEGAVIDASWYVDRGNVAMDAAHALAGLLTVLDRQAADTVTAAAEIGDLATWIDAHLDDENTDRQWIAESAASMARDIADLAGTGRRVLPRGRCEEHGGRDLAACDHGAVEPMRLAQGVNAYPNAVTPAGSVELGASDVVLVLAALDDAAQARLDSAEAWCSDCLQAPAGACDGCLDSLDAVDKYKGLAARLGGDL